MNNVLTESELEFIVARLLDNANDAFSENKDDPFTRGKRLAYYEMLDTIKNELDARDIDLQKYGLDISLEKLL